VLFRPLAELCITAAVCNIIDAKEARDISRSGHPDMVMLSQLEEGAVVGAAVPSPPVKAAADKEGVHVTLQIHSHEEEAELLARGDGH
jgi:hypothetical protein